MRLLLETGVEDTNNLVLQGAFMSNDVDVVALLLQFKSVKDTGHGINKSELLRLLGHGELTRSGSMERQGPGDGDNRPRSLVTAVAIQWQNLRALYEMQVECLVGASLRLNPALRNKDFALALCAITKVDISGNSFQKFPGCLLMMPSLVVLNASKNSIVEMPEEEDRLSISFMCPVLEELHLQENKLSIIPAYVFHFPALKYLDVSFNSIRELPPDLWLAPSLISLDLTRNVLGKLPVFSKDNSLPRKMSVSKRLSGVSFTGSVGVRRESQSMAASVTSSDLEVNASVFDYSVDNVEAAGAVLTESNVTSNEVIHINKWSSSLKVGGHYQISSFSLSRKSM